MKKNVDRLSLSIGIMNAERPSPEDIRATGHPDFDKLARKGVLTQKGFLQTQDKGLRSNFRDADNLGSTETNWLMIVGVERDHGHA
jgi:hypothetical protein